MIHPYLNTICNVQTNIQTENIVYFLYYVNTTEVCYDFLYQPAYLFGLLSKLTVEVDFDPLFVSLSWNTTTGSKLSDISFITNLMMCASRKIITHNYNTISSPLSDILYLDEPLCLLHIKSHVRSMLLIYGGTINLFRGFNTYTK